MSESAETHFIVVTFILEPDHFRFQVEDADGTDITHMASGVRFNRDMRRGWADLELQREGFDGPFSTPAIGVCAPPTQPTKLMYNSGL